MRAAGRELPRLIKVELDKIGREILVPLIVSKMEKAFVLPLGDKRDHQHRSGKLLKSVRAVSQQRYGIVKEGVAATPYAGWWEFGGSTHSSRGNPDREFEHEGRTMYPSLHEARPVIQRESEFAMERLRAKIEAVD